MMRTALALGLLTALSTPVLAQDVEEFSICDVDPANYATEVAARLVGSWSAVNGEGRGTMSGGGMVMPIPIPAEAAEPVDIILHGDSDLTMTSFMDAESAELEMTIVSGPSLIDGATSAIGTGLTEEELSVVQGCDIAAFPHLRTQFVMAEDGVMLNYVATFRVLSHNLMVGAVHGTVTGPDGAIEVYRPVTMSR